MSRNRLIARLNGQALPVSVLVDGRVQVDAAEGPFTVRRVGDGEYLVSDAVRSWRVWVAGPPDGRSVHVDGKVLELDLAPEGATKRHGRGAGPEALVAPMPATVIEILVEPGQSVRQGDVLVKLEAMKMELPLRAPQDGRVRHVRCTPGELVQPGVPLLEMEGLTQDGGGKEP
jgi:3-methylcrotonyl-CoA carboxylase alpha subunit